jgi:hypothetical protein
MMCVANGATRVDRVFLNLRKPVVIRRHDTIFQVM